MGGRGVEWPARTLDLKPLHFLWGPLKNKVYHEPVEMVEDLRIRILNAFASLRRRYFRRAIQNTERHINLCIENNGNLFEYLL